MIVIYYSLLSPIQSTVCLLRFFYLNVDQEMHFTLSAIPFWILFWNSLKPWWKTWTIGRLRAVPLPSDPGPCLVRAGAPEAAAVGGGAPAQRGGAESGGARVRTAVPGRPSPLRVQQSPGRRLLLRPHWKRFVEVLLHRSAAVRSLITLPRNPVPVSVLNWNLFLKQTLKVH